MLPHHLSPAPHGPLQERICAGAARTSVPQLEARLRAAGAEYVAAASAKRGGVYLDVVAPDEYDALAPLRWSVKFPVGDIVDPLKRDLLKTKAEQELLRVGGSSIAGGGGRASGGGGQRASGGGGSGGGGGALRASGGSGGRCAAAEPGSLGTGFAAVTRLDPAATRSVLDTTKWCAAGRGQGGRHQECEGG